MAADSLRAVVATSTLDLGIDWGDVDLVVHVGAPKGASRLAQRIGRANHRMDEPSQGASWCRPTASRCWSAGPRSTPTISARRTRRRCCAGALDVLAQHVLGMACARAVRCRRALRRRCVSAAPYRELDRETFERVVDFVATGGYALRTYERYAKHPPDARTGCWRVSHPRIAQQYRLNVGTIVEAPMLNVRYVAQRQGRRRRAAGRCSARSRNISSRR